MEPINRRRFLMQGGAAVAAAGVVSAVPFSAADAVTKGDSGAHAAAVADAKSDEPVVAHVRDLKSGEVVLFRGHREVTVKDKHLATLLFNASH